MEFQEKEGDKKRIHNYNYNLQKVQTVTPNIPFQSELTLTENRQTESTYIKRKRKLIS